jgi:hypothetical protein
MSDSLRTKTLHGVSWSFLDLGGQLGIQFVISIILARLLLPAQFGLIAMLSIFMAVAQSLVDSGFGQALIQKQDATRVDESSIFYFNIIFGFVAAGLLCLAAPWIAAFYKMPLLVPLTRVLSLSLVINAFGLVQTALMTKRVLLLPNGTSPDEEDVSTICSIIRLVAMNGDELRARIRQAKDQKDLWKSTSLPMEILELHVRGQASLSTWRGLLKAAASG